MITLTADTANELYVAACRAVLRDGVVVSPRGIATTEPCLPRDECHASSTDDHWPRSAGSEGLTHPQEIWLGGS